MSASLTLRQRAFLLAYLNGPPGLRGNALASAREVGYSAKNTGIGTQVLAMPAVKAALTRYATKVDITAERVLGELAKIAFSDLRDVLDWGAPMATAGAKDAALVAVRVRPSSEIPDAAAAAIAEIAETEHGVRVKLHDKLGALRDLGKYLRLFGPTSEDGTPASTTVFNTQINITNLAQLTDEELEVLERATARLQS